MVKIMISVIIPVYNSEKFVENCVERLNPNKYDIEIILVNDGSKDNSLDICRRLEKKYENVRAFDKENGGVSSARNFGIEKANGEWIMFVDADDYLDTRFFDDNDSLIISEEKELIHFGCVTNHYSECDEKPVEEKRLMNIESLVEMKYADVDIKKSFIELFRNNVFDSVWGKLYRKDIIDKFSIRFIDGMKVREDSDFVLKYAYNIKQICIINGYYYHYRVVGNEMTYYLRREIPLNDIYNLKQAYESILDKNNSDQSIREVIDKHMLVLICAGITHMSSSTYGGTFNELYKYICDAGMIFEDLFNRLQGGSRFYKLLITLLKKKKYILCAIICKLRYSGVLKNE